MAQFAAGEAEVHHNTLFDVSYPKGWKEVHSQDGIVIIHPPDTAPDDMDPTRQIVVISEPQPAEFSSMRAFCENVVNQIRGTGIPVANESFEDATLDGCAAVKMYMEVDATAIREIQNIKSFKQYNLCCYRKSKIVVITAKHPIDAPTSQLDAFHSKVVNSFTFVDHDPFKFSCIQLQHIQTEDFFCAVPTPWKRAALPAKKASHHKNATAPSAGPAVILKYDYKLDEGESSIEACVIKEETTLTLEEYKKLFVLQLNKQNKPADIEDSTLGGLPAFSGNYSEPTKSHVRHFYMYATVFNGAVYTLRMRALVIRNDEFKGYFDKLIAVIRKNFFFDKSIFTDVRFIDERFQTFIDYNTKVKICFKNEFIVSRNVNGAIAHFTPSDAAQTQEIMEINVFKNNKELYTKVYDELFSQHKFEKQVTTTDVTLFGHPAVQERLCRKSAEGEAVLMLRKTEVGDDVWYVTIVCREYNFVKNWRKYGLFMFDNMSFLSDSELVPELAIKYTN